MGGVFRVYMCGGRDENVRMGRGDAIVSVDHSVSVGGGPIEPNGGMGVVRGTREASRCPLPPCAETSRGTALSP